MRYQTPQFIEEDEKLFGPLTFRQFVYLVGGLGISFVLYKTLPFLISLLVIIPVMMTSVALAFYKVNERPFIDTLEAAFFFMFSNRLYTYKKIDKPIKQSMDDQKTRIAPQINLGVSSSKLKDLAWSLDINEKTNSRVGDNQKLNI
jgi:hypothetical protein